MLLVVITFLLIAVGVLAYAYGAWKLSRFAARISGGLAMGVLLFPPVAFWFAFYKLEEEGKEFPTTMWLFGIVSSLLMLIVFWTPISYVLTGRMAELETPTGVAATAVAEYGIKPGEEKPAPTPTPDAPPVEANNAAGTNNAPAGTNTAPAATNNAPAGTNNAPAATNSAPAATNNAPAPAAAAGTAAGAAQ